MTAIAIMAPFVFLVVGAWLAGWHLQPLESGSMEPTYATGSLLVVAPVDGATAKVGMPIVFADARNPDRLVVHRVVGVAPDGAMLRTRGDGNDTDDPYLVAVRDVRGQVRWAVPGLGRFTGLLRWPVNVLVLVVAPLGVLVGSEVVARRRRRRRAVQSDAHDATHDPATCPGCGADLHAEDPPDPADTDLVPVGAAPDDVGPPPPDNPQSDDPGLDR